MYKSENEPVPQLNDQTTWRIGICSSGGKSAGTAFVIRRNGRYVLVELEIPAPVPGGSDDDLFILEPDGEPLRELVAELCPLWLPIGPVSELAYVRHFPNGLAIEDL